MRNILLITVLVLTSLLSGGGRAPAEERLVTNTRTPERIRFHIVMIEEKGTERNSISEAVVEGPPNTDFNVNLEDKRFRMRARFLTDLIQPGALKVRARIDTRRLYGYSERELPLYEEDEQIQSLELGFDESVVLLPFGRGSGDHRLKIEITPAISEQTSISSTGKKRPLEISILKPGPSGIISIEASKVPHNFMLEAVLLEDGREVAGGTVPLLIEEPQEIALQPNAVAGAKITENLLFVNLAIERYARSRPADQVTFGFDVYLMKSGQGERRERVAQSWAGVASLDSAMTYDLSKYYLSETGRKYELRFKFKLAPGERAD